MIDLESMNQFLGLAWIKKKSLGEMTAHQKLTPAVHGKAIYNIFGINLDVCVFFLLLHCSYDFEDIPTTTQFYTELLTEMVV